MDFGIRAGIYQHFQGKRYTFINTLPDLMTQQNPVVLLLDGDGKYHYVTLEEFTKRVKYPDYLISIAGLDTWQDGGQGPQFIHQPERT